MKLTFRMTAEEYYLGWKYKIKKGKLQNSFMLLLPIVLMAVVVILAGIFELGWSVIISALLVIFFSLMTLNIQRKNILKQYSISKYLNGDNTVRIFDEGIEIFNSYQKIYAPWQSVFAVKEDAKYLYILPTFSKGIYVIDKIRYKSEELDKIIGAIASHMQIEGGTR